MADNKKRGAVRQLTKDDDPDAEEETPSESGTFKKASEEVLATRRIVKVRRTSGSVTQPTGPNPFANIQLSLSSPAVVAPAPVPAADATPKLASNVDGEVVPSAELLTEASIRAGEVVAESEKVEEKVAEPEVVNGSAEKPSENGGKDEGGKPEAPTSFQQVSSTPNAFGSFTSGSGFTFPTTTFTFGSPGGFNFGSSSTGSSFTLGSFSSTSETKPVAGFESSAPSSSSPPVQPNYATVSLQEVATETGEENEEAVFACDGVLYEFVEKSWKERGKGELKVNIAQDNKARLVMRSKGNFKLLLNAGLFPDMKTSRMDTRSVTFACANSAKEGGVLSTYAIKLREAEAVSVFLELIEEHKGVKISPAAPKVAVEAKDPAAGEAPAAGAAAAAAEEDEDQSKESA